jgi:transposase-like protein
MSVYMDEWRYTCPNGHASWTGNARGDYRCRSCGVVFSLLFDTKAGMYVTRTAREGAKDV